MGLKEKLQLIDNCKSSIRNKIIDKGVYVAESVPFKDYPNYIQRIEAQSVVQASEEWTPDPLWWDIETILANDTNPDNPELDECDKAIFLIDTIENPSIQLSINNTSLIAFKTSDGGFYKATSSSNVSKSHTWDNSKSKQSSRPSQKTAYVILYAIKDSHVSSSINTPCIYIISNINWHNASSGSTSAYYTSLGGNNNLEGLKLLEGTVCSTKSGYTPCWFGSYNLKYLDIQCPLTHKGWVLQFDIFRNLTYWKVNPENISAIDDVTGLKHYNLPSACEKILDILDVSEIDFSEAYGTIYTNLMCRKIQGVIDLSGNTLNTSFNLFKTGMNPMSYSLILPHNADVKINHSYITGETAKFLVENAPVIEEAHTLSISSTLYNYLKKLPHTHLALYNGEQFSDGVQVLTLKGWTVQTT